MTDLVTTLTKERSKQRSKVTSIVQKDIMKLQVTNGGYKINN